MSKLLGTEDGYEIHLGQKNPSCYPCCWEGSVAARLNAMGFYARFGWRETTPNGNKRPIVVVMLERPPRVPVWKTGTFWLFTILGAVLLSLIVGLIISKP